jgi:hypothetical protein
LTFNGLHGVISEKKVFFTFNERLLISTPASEGALLKKGKNILFNFTLEDETTIASYATEIQSIPIGLTRHVSHTAKKLEDKTDCAVMRSDFVLS